MEYKQIINNLKQKQYSPVYLLLGDEPFYIDKIANYITGNALAESEKAFNLLIIYGKDTTAADVINAAKRFPMMAPFQVVVLKEAQDLKDIDDLHYYADNPLKSTILVICYKHKPLDKRKKLYKAAKSKGVIFESKKIYDNQVAEWVQNYAKEIGMQIQPNAAALVSESIGADLARIANDLDKLLITIGKDTTITSQHIADYVGVSKDFNNLELQNAIINRNAAKAFRIVEYFGANSSKNPIVRSITNLYFFFNKLLHYHQLKDKSKNNVALNLGINPYFVKDYVSAAKNYPFSKVEQIISLLRQYDLKSKGVNNVSAKDGDLLKELVYKILH